MKEFVEKLIGRLEEKEKCYHERALDEIMNNGHTMDAEGFLEKEDTYGDATSIVKELAEEYINTSTDTSSGWIPCSERLPNIEHISGVSETVLVTTNNNSIFTAEYHRDGKWLDDVADWSLEVIAWQSLPAPYKEGVTENE